MSPSIAEKARAEADEAEAEEQHEQPTEEPAAEPDAEPVVEPEPHPGEGLDEPTDQMIAELQVACDEHHDRVHMIMGPFVDGFVPCEACNGIGLGYPTPAGPKFADAPQTVACNVCNGLGELKTGSSRQGFELIQCSRCNGRGYVGPDNVPTTSSPQATVETYPVGADTGNGLEQPPAPESTDPWVAEAESRGYIVLKKPGA